MWWICYILLSGKKTWGSYVQHFTLKTVFVNLTTRRKRREENVQKVKDGSIKWYRSSLYKRISKNNINVFVNGGGQNQPISPNQDVWIVQRRGGSQNWKLAKLAFKRKFEALLEQYFLKERTLLWELPIEEIQEISEGTFSHEGLKSQRQLKSVYSLMIATYLKLLIALSDAARCCSMISRWRLRDNYLSLGDTRWRW